MTTDDIYSWLQEVSDPEIPAISIVDLGIISNVEVNDNIVNVEITPTFVGCPAIDVICTSIKETMIRHGAKSANVRVSFHRPWTSDRITDRGKKALKSFGLAPPPPAAVINDIDFLSHATCPRCGGHDTDLKSPFGPTLCRSIHYCNECREAFEQFKPL